MTTPKAITKTKKTKKTKKACEEAKLPMTKVQSQNNDPLHPPQSKWHDNVGLVVQKDYFLKSWVISW